MRNFTVRGCTTEFSEAPPVQTSKPRSKLNATQSVKVQNEIEILIEKQVLEIVVSLVALHVAARAQTLTCLDFNKMTKSKSKVIFKVCTSGLKQSRTGYTPQQVELKALWTLWTGAMCVQTFEVYIECTKHLRNTE